MKEKVNVLAKKLKPYSIPGAITLAVVLITLILKGIWPFGGNRIDYFDNMQQVAPLYAHLWDFMHVIFSPEKPHFREHFHTDGSKNGIYVRCNVCIAQSQIPEAALSGKDSVCRDVFAVWIRHFIRLLLYTVDGHCCTVPAADAGA